MTSEIAGRGAAQVHWLVVGQFGLGEEGKTLSLTRADFNEALEKTGIEIEATVRDTIGAADTRTVSMKVSSLKHLSLRHVLSSVPELGELAGKADQLAKLKDPSMDDLRSILGEGRLLDSLKALVAPEEAAPAADAEGATSGDTDAILEKAVVAKPTAKSAIDMFMKAAKKSGPTSSKPTGRKLRDAVEQAVWGLAADVLKSEEVQAIEGAWRGLRFLLTQCPKDAGMEVILLESAPENALDALGARDRGDDIDEPDCIFIPHDYGTTEGLSQLADFAEQELIPIVVGGAPGLFGVDHPQGVPDQFEALEQAKNDELPEWAAKWDGLRVVESTRWLSVVANRVALHSEGKGAAERVAFGSGVWGVAALLAQSFAKSGGFARIFGKTGSLQAPASNTLKGGRYTDTAAPTEAFYAIAPSEMLAKNGVFGLGAARNSDTLVLSKAPVVRGAKDAVPLPAQILTGRVVRFATWVKAQLPEGCDSATANDIFMSAASIFLFPGQEEAAHVRAATVNIEGEAHVVVRAVANPAVASVPFEISFPLPLHWSVPAPEESGESAAPAKPAAGAAANVADETSGDTGGGVGLAGGSVGFDVGLGNKD